MGRLALALLFAALTLPALADMFPDASNAKLPETLGNLGIQTPAACDGRVAADGNMPGGSATLTSASAAFTAADAGKLVSVRKAGARFFASTMTVSAGGAGHAVGDLVTFPDGVSVFVVAVTAGAVTAIYPVSLGSSATSPATIAQTSSVKSGSTLAAPIAGGTGLVLAPTWVRENLVTTIVSGSGTSATLAAPASAAVAAVYFGYGSDYGPEIQAALTAAQPVDLPRGICGHSNTLAPGEAARLVGKGIGGNSTVGTTLLYLGPAGQPQVSLGNLTGARVQGTAFGDLKLEGLGAASKGLYVRGLTSGVFYDTAMTGHTTVGLDIHGNNSGIDSIKNWFQRLDIAEGEGSSADLNTHGIWWGYPNTYDTGNDHDLSVYGPIQTKLAGKGIGLICGVTDHNTVTYIQTRGDASVPGVEMLGGNWSAIGHCRNNHFLGMDAGDGGLKVRSTGWLQKPENQVDFYDRGNGGADHSVEDGATLDIRDSDGRWDGIRVRPRSYANVPVPMPEGSQHYVIDGVTRTPGAVVSGAVGTYRTPVYFDGTNWRVAFATRPRAVLNTNWATPAGTTSTTHVMQGLGSAAALTPAVSGNVMVTLNGHVANSAAAGTTRVRLQYGTGTAPANGAAITGNTACLNSPQVTWTSPTAAAALPFSLTCIVTGLTLDTPAWFDAAIAGSAANTSTITGVTIQAAEQ